MDIFLTLFTNLLPLYGLIALGFIAGRYLEVDGKSLANIALYICVPVVAFGFVVDLDFKPIYLGLPIVFFIIFSAIALVFLKIGKKVYGDKRANLLAMCASSLNTGYFGLPVMLLLFDPHWVAVYLFMMMGGLIFEATLFYYIAARGVFDMRESLVRLAKFSAIYAIIIAIIFNLNHVQMPEMFDTYFTHFTGAYVILGMMIIGTALAKAGRLVWAPRFLGLTFLAQFIIWPLLMVAIVWLDRSYTHWFDPEIHRFIIITALLPPAANTAAFAAQFDLRPDKAATTVLLGTLFALVYIPAMLVLLGLY